MTVYTVTRSLQRSTPVEGKFGISHEYLEEAEEAFRIRDEME